VYLYQIIRYLMQQVFIWSQTPTPLTQNALDSLLIGHNSFSISTSLGLSKFKTAGREGKDQTAIGLSRQKSWALSIFDAQKALAEPSQKR
jgi:hypothetical protein